MFARDGYERASTNAIAAEAGVSPGTFYQFFRDKQSIAIALGQRYAAALDEAHRAAFVGIDLQVADLRTLLDRVLDPMVAFKEKHAAYVTLFARPDTPGLLGGPVADAESAFERRVAEVLRSRDPALDADDAATAARTVFAVIRGGIAGLRVGSSELAELKTVIVGYLHERGIR